MTFSLAVWYFWDLGSFAFRAFGGFRVLDLGGIPLPHPKATGGRLRFS